MKRIATNNRAVDMHGPGKDGFRASVPGVSDPTYLSAAWANAVQEAIVRVIENGGLAPADDYDQFAFALNYQYLRLVRSRNDIKSLSKGAMSQCAFINSYYGDGKSRSKLFYLDQADTTSTDNGGTVIVANDGGRWKAAKFGLDSIADFGARVDGTTVSSSAFAIAIASNVQNTLRVNAGVTLCGDIQNSSTSIEGDGLSSVLKAAPGATTVLNLGFSNIPSQWAQRCISNLTVLGNGKTADGITFRDVANSEMSGRWVLERVIIEDCHTAIRKQAGNIGNAIRDCAISGNDFGYYALGQTAPLMHAGCDLFDHVQFDTSLLAAIYIDSPQIGTGGTTITGNTIIEGNPGFGVFVKNYKTSFTPLVLDGVWFENNATAATVTINDTVYAPKDVYFENVEHAVIRNGIVRKFQFVASRVSIDNCFADDQSYYTIDAASTVSVTNASLDGGVHPVVIKSLIAAKRPGGNQAQVFLAEPRKTVSKSSNNVLQSLSFSNADSYSFSGSASVIAQSAVGGILFDTYASLTIAPGKTQLGGLVSVTAGKWYVATLDANLLNGNKSNLLLGVYYNTTLCSSWNALLQSGAWNTVATVCQATASDYVSLYIQNNDAAAITLGLSAFQLMEFTTEQDALNYYNSGRYSAPDRPLIIYAQATPTVVAPPGTRCINTSGVIGQPKEWIRSTSGTWVAQANL